MNQQHFVTFTIKTISDLDKHIKTMDKAFKSSSGLTKAFNDIGKATKIATAAISSLTTALSQFVSIAKAVAEFGQQFVNFSIATGKGAAAIKNLNSAYSELRSTSKGLLVSMADLAEFQSKFAGQSISNLILSGSKESVTAFAGLQSQLTKAVGKSGAQSMILGITEGLKDSPALQKGLMQQLSKGGSSGLQLLVGGDNIAQLVQIASALDTINNNTDKAQSATMKYNEMIAKLDTALTDITQKFINAFGDEMLAFITALTNGIDSFGKDGGSAIDWVISKMGTLMKITATVAGAIAGSIAGPIGSLIGAAAGYGAAEYAGIKLEEIQQIAKIEEGLIKQKRQQKGAADAGVNIDSTLQMMIKSRLAFEEANFNMSVFVKNTEAARGVMDSLSGLVREAGGNTEQLSKVSEFALKNAEATLASSEKSLAAAATHVAEMKQLMDKIYADPKADEDSKATAKQNYVQSLQREADVQKSIVSAQQTIFKTQEAAVSKQLFNLEMAEKQEAVYQRQLEISKALPGALGANLAAIKGVVEQIDKEKAILEDMAKYWAEREQNEKDTEYARKKRLETEEKIKNKQLQQLNLLKELRDGYLQAVEASAIGAGRFEKILFTQEKNLGLALDMRNAKANFLLGQVGSAASQFSKLPGQFDPNNFGGVNAVGGGAMTPQAWNAQSQANQRLANIEDQLKKMGGASAIPTGAPAEVLKGSAANRPSSPAPASGPSSKTRDIGGNGSSELREISRLAAIAADKIDSTVEVNADVVPQKRGAPVHNP